jgi:hypothetical protein
LGCAPLVVTGAALDAARRLVDSLNPISSSLNTRPSSLNTLPSSLNTLPSSLNTLPSSPGNPMLSSPGSTGGSIAALCLY